MKSLLIMSQLIALFAFAGGQDGNGGAGLEENGTYKTFYTAGLYVEPIYLTDSTLPELRSLRNEIRKMNLNPKIEGALAAILSPSFERKYLNVDSTHFDQSTLKTLKEIYRKIYKMENSDIIIYAVTDISSNTTYLLPEFYKLSGVEKNVILLHEALWLMKPETTYKEITTMDLYSQNYFTKYSADSLFTFVEALDNFLEVRYNGSRWGFSNNIYFGSLYGMTLKWDLAQNNLKELVNENGAIKLGNLFGIEGFKCIKNYYEPSSDSSDNLIKSCGLILKSYWSQLSDSHPSSLFIRALLNMAKPRIAEWNSVGTANLIRYYNMTSDDLALLDVNTLYQSSQIYGIINVQRKKCESKFWGSETCSKKTKKYLVPLISLIYSIYINKYSDSNEDTLFREFTEKH